MRFNLKFEVTEQKLPVDYRVMFLSFLKYAFEKNDVLWYEKNYSVKEGEKDIVVKPFSFSAYLNKPKFTENVIELDGNNVNFNFTTSSPEYGIHFFNSVLKQLYKSYKYKEFEIKLNSITMAKEKTIKENVAVFKTMSPIVVRQHNKKENTDKNILWSENEFSEQLKANIQEGAKDFFDFDISEDIKQMKVKVINMKEVLVAHFNDRIKKRIDANIGTIRIEGKTYLLDWIYKSGLGSRRSQGFGMVDVME